MSAAWSITSSGVISDGWTLSEVVLESVSSPRARTPRAATRVLQVGVALLGGAVRTNSIAVSAPTERTSPSTLEPVEQRAERPRATAPRSPCTWSSTPGRVSSSSIASAAAQLAGNHAQVLPVDTSSNGAQHALRAEQRADRASRRRRVPCPGRSGPGRHRAARPRGTCRCGRSRSSPRRRTAASRARRTARLSAGKERRRRHDDAAGAEDRLDDDARHIGRVDRVEEQVVAQVVDGRVAGAAGRGAPNGLRYGFGYGTWTKPGDDRPNAAAELGQPRRRASRWSRTRRGSRRGSR